MFNFKKTALIISAAALVMGGVSGCSVGDATPDEVTVVTHDSVVFTDEVIKAFKDETGITIKQIKAGDAGAMTNKLVLTKDAPIGDAFFGIDNTFAGVAIDNDIVNGALEPVDFGDVCFNYDKTWFSTNELPAPTSIKDLTKPAYKGLTVVSNPTTSSPGLAFLATTVSMFGDNGWEQYWTALKANDVKVDAGWEDAYFTDFSGSSVKGAYPIVLSYSSSPAFEVRDNGESQTASILDGCFRQTEFAGVLKNAKNPEAAKKLVLFLINETFQKTLPTQMYVYPVLPTVALPDEWAEFAPTADNTYGDALDINANRKDWFAKWSEIFSAN